MCKLRLVAQPQTITNKMIKCVSLVAQPLTMKINDQMHKLSWGETT